MTDDLIRRTAALECCNEMLRKSKPLEKSTSAIELRRAIAAPPPAAQVRSEPVAIDCDLGMACHFPRMEVYYSEAERNRARAELVTTISPAIRVLCGDCNWGCRNDGTQCDECNGHGYLDVTSATPPAPPSLPCAAALPRCSMSDSIICIHINN